MVRLQLNQKIWSSLMVEQKNHNLKVRGSIPLFINTGMVKLVDTLVLETNNFGYTGSTPVTCIKFKGEKVTQSVEY